MDQGGPGTAGAGKRSTTYRSNSETGPDPDAVNAALLCRDHLLSLVDAVAPIAAACETARPRRSLPRPKASASAVSQRTANTGWTWW